MTCEYYPHSCSSTEDDIPDCSMPICATDMSEKISNVYYLEDITDEKHNAMLNAQEAYTKACTDYATAKVELDTVIATIKGKTEQLVADGVITQEYADGTFEYLAEQCHSTRKDSYVVRKQDAFGKWGCMESDYQVAGTYRGIQFLLEVREYAAGFVGAVGYHVSLWVGKPAWVGTFKDATWNCYIYNVDTDLPGKDKIGIRFGGYRPNSDAELTSYYTIPKGALEEQVPYILEKIFNRFKRYRTLDYRELLKSVK